MENGAKMVALVILLALVVMVAMIIAITGGKDRYPEMSEKEFEEEAQRASVLGAALSEFHKFFQPKRVEFQLKRVEGDSAEAGDPPPAEPPPQ